MRRPRIVLVDDLPEMIEYCRDILKAGYDVVGTAADGQSGIAAFEARQPDVLVLDISMPGMDGIEAARRLRVSGCRAPIVFVSSSLERAAAAMEAGGSAFVAKSRIAEDLLFAVSEALAGRMFVSGFGK